MPELSKTATVREWIWGSGWMEGLRNGAERSAAGETMISKISKSDGQLPGLYGLRAIAALMIVIFHLSANVRVPPAFQIIQTHFGMGVPLFFVLSGFSLMYSTSRYVGRDGWVQIYLIKRFFRIAPLFYVMVVFFSIFNIFVWHLMPSPPLVLINVLFLYNLVPGYHESIVWAGWTLGVEMLFYAMFPVLLITVTNFRRGLFLFILSVLASIAADHLLAAKGQSAYASMSLVVNAHYFIAGIMTFFVYRHLAQRDVRPPFVGVLGTLALAFAIWVIVFIQSTGIFIYTHKLYPVTCAVVFGLLCIWQALYPSSVLSSSPAQYCGEHSYSIYLVHAVTIYELKPVYGYIYGVVGSDLLAFFVSTAVAITAALCCASITFRFIELPGIKLGAALIEKSRRGAQTVIPRTLPAVQE